MNHHCLRAYSTPRLSNLQGPPPYAPPSISLDFTPVSIMISSTQPLNPKPWDA